MCGSVIVGDNTFVVVYMCMAGVGISLFKVNEEILVGDSDGLIDWWDACTKSLGVIDCRCIKQGLIYEQAGNIHHHRTNDINMQIACCAQPTNQDVVR